MSRWAEAFAALADQADTVDTVDTVDGAAGQAPTVSHCVNSVSGSVAFETAGPNAADTLEPDEVEERIAIVAENTGTPVEWCAAFARLDPDRPPADVPLHRWRRLIDDFGRFLDGGFAEKALALGWSPHDLFGCDRYGPFARIDRAGLLWLLDGNRLAEMHADRAVIVINVTGSPQTYRRKSQQQGRILLWELVP